MSEPEFKGFVWPEQNWFRLPNNWVNITRSIKSCIELKVIEYVLRHTWGYSNQRDESKRITLDEFENGRKYADGSRIDQGIGMDRRTVRNGIKLAVEHGYLEVTEDRRDLGRIKRYFNLKMVHPGGKNLVPWGAGESCTQRGQMCAPEGSNVRPRGVKSPPRTEKDNSRKTNKGKTFGPPKKRRPVPPSKLLPSDGNFNKKAGRKLLEVLQRYDADLTHTKRDSKGKVTRRSVAASTLAKSVAEIRTKGRAGKDEIKAVIRWLKDHYGDTYTPKMSKADDFSTYWGRYRDAKKGWENDRRDGGDVNGVYHPTEDEHMRDRIVGEVRQWLEREKGMDTSKPNVCVYEEEVDEALVALGHEPGCVDYDEV